MANLKRILIVVDWYLPATNAGGPVRSVAAIISRLKDSFDFSVFTSDRDLGDPTAYADLPLHQWTSAPDMTRTWYCSMHAPVGVTFSGVLKSEKPDIVYINGIFSSFSRTALRIARKNKVQVVIAPRGMLGKGALNIKAAKKKIFLSYAKLVGMYDNVRWHASSEQEKSEVLAVFPGAEVQVAMNLSLPLNGVDVHKEKSRGHVNLIFLSRISEKKNLEGLLTILSYIGYETFINLDIYGPIEDEEYWKRCQTLAHSLPENITVVYQGPLPHEKIAAAFTASDLFVFPTFHENFGHTIAEALQCGTPVLISDQTPWKNLTEHKAGWDLPLEDPKAFAAIIEKVAAMDESELAEWRRGAKEFAARYSNDEKLVALNRNLFA